MLKKVQPKVWWAALFAVFVIVLSLVWVRNSKSHDLVNFKRNAKSNPNLDPVEIKDPDAKTLAKIEQIQDIFRRKRNAGFNGNVLIVQKGKILYQNSFGYAHLRDKDSLQSHSKFQLASLSKPFTAVAILKLIQEGKVSLEDSVQRFFPDFPYHGVKVDMLLSHRSGLPNYIYSFPG